MMIIQQILFFQIEGETKWKIFKNRISYLYRTGTMNGKLVEEDLELDIEVNLTPGDVLYIFTSISLCLSSKESV